MGYNTSDGTGHISHPAQKTPCARTQPIWEYLLLAAALLFPLDVAARRLRLARSDWERVRNVLRVPSRAQTQTTAPRALEGLFTARERAQTRPGVSRSTTPVVSQDALHPENRNVVQPAPVARQKDVVTQKESPPPAPTESVNDEDMNTRLKRARDRARKGGTMK